MPHDVTLRGPLYTFHCHGVHEAKQLGLIDSWLKEGTHAPVSTVFEHGEGKLLADWIANVPDALLVATGRYQITVFRPKSRLILLPERTSPGAPRNPRKPNPNPHSHENTGYYHFGKPGICVRILGAGRGERGVLRAAHAHRRNHMDSPRLVQGIHLVGDHVAGGQGVADFRVVLESSRFPPDLAQHPGIRRPNSCFDGRAAMRDPINRRASIERPVNGRWIAISERDGRESPMKSPRAKKRASASQDTPAELEARRERQRAVCYQLLDRWVPVATSAMAWRWIPAAPSISPGRARPPGTGRPGSSPCTPMPAAMTPLS